MAVLHFGGCQCLIAVPFMWQERERGIAADSKATIQRAKAKHETSKFQTMQ